MTLSRILVTVFAGGAALGLVEGARILVAPVLLTVQGFGSYLLSSYVRDKELGVSALRRRAWRASGSMKESALNTTSDTAPVGPLIRCRDDPRTPAIAVNTIAV